MNPNLRADETASPTHNPGSFTADFDDSRQKFSPAVSIWD